MRVPRIFTEQTLAPHNQLQLESGPSQHLSRALRMGPGDSLILFDGRGGQYSATISSANKNNITVDIGSHEPVELESCLQIHLGIAVSRGERMDWVIQKSTELGVTKMTPLHTERTEVKLKGERALKKLKHWQHIAISACEQSGRNCIPEINPVTPLDEWLAAAEAQRKFVLHHRADSWVQGETPGSIALLIGPEGGLSASEIEAALANGYEAMQLGPRVLRTETAPLAALAILQTVWGDM